MRIRKKYSKEFKQEAVRLAEASGNTAATARELGIHASVIRCWMKQIEDDGKRAFPGYVNPQDEELAKLLRKNKRLKEENVVLKKAAGIFSRDLR